MFKKRGIHESFLIVLVVIFTLLFLSFVVAESNTEFRIHYLGPDNGSFFGPQFVEEPAFTFNVNGTNASYKVNLIFNGGQNNSGFVDNGTLGNLSLTANIADMADGFYVYYFNASNGSVSNYTATNRTLTIDNTVPQISYAAMEPNEAFITKNSFLLNISYTETNRANITFRIRDSGDNINTTIISDESVSHLNLTSVTGESAYSDENLTINVTIYDNATNTNITSNRVVIVDTTIPQIESHTSSSIINNSNTSSSSIFVNMSFTEQNFGNLTFKFAPTSYVVINTTVVSEWSTPYLNITSVIGGAGLSDANVTMNVTITDRAGNTNISTYGMVLDQTLPTFTYAGAVQPNATFINNDYIYVNVSVTEANLINLSFSLLNSTGAINYSLLSDTIGDGAGSAINFTQMDSKAGALPEGNYTFNVTASDIAENQNTSINQFIVLDRTSPTTDYQAATTVANNSNVSTDYAFFNMTFTEQNLGNLTFALSPTDYTSTNSTVVSEWSTPYVNFTSLTSGNALPDGNYTFNVTIIDRASNVANSEIRTFFYDPTLPVVMYSHGSSVAGDSGTAATYIFVNTTITETNLINLTFNLRNESGAVNATLISDAIGDSNLTYVNFTSMTEGLALPEGNYTFNVTGTDRMGNKNTSVNGTIIIDQQFPNLSYHADTPANKTNLTKNSIYVKVNVTEQNLANISFVLANSSFVNETWVTDTNVSFVNFSRLGDGYYKFNVTITDVSNQVNFTATRNVTVDTTAPDAITVSASPSSVNGGESVSLSCGATDNLGGDISYVIEVQKPSGSYEVQTSSASVSYTDTASVSGTYNVRCTATDVYGNADASSTSFSVSIESGSSGGSSGGSSASYAPEVEEEVEEEEEEVEVEEVEEEITAAVVLEEESSWEETGVLEYASAVVGDVIEMTFTTNEGEEEGHSVTLSEVNVEEQFVILVFESDPQELTLYVGESRNLDIDTDGNDDFEVTLNTINEDGTVDLTFTKLEGWLENEGVEQKSYWWVGLVVALVVVAGIVWFFVAKKK